MIVQDAFEIWNDAEEIRQKIFALRDKVVDAEIEPELAGRLVEAAVDVSRVIASIRYYEVVEDSAAALRRADWGSQIIYPPGHERGTDDQHNPSD